MRDATIFERLLHLQGLKIRAVSAEPERLVVFAERRFERLTCPRCGRRSRARESEKLRRWRHLGFWGYEVLIEAPIRRFRCRPCDAVVTEAVPWARHGSDFTQSFEDAVARLAQQMNRTAVSEFTGLAWVTVGNIGARVVAEKLDAERFRTLRRLAVDEISFRKRHRYLTVVTDHDTRRIIWVGEGKSAEALDAFFQLIGPEACAGISLVTMDMSAAFEKAVRDRLPNAKIVFDHFHLVKLANTAVDEVRRTLMRTAPNPEARAAIKGTRWPLLHGTEALSEKDAAALAFIRPNSALGRAWLLKEHLCDILKGRFHDYRSALKDWVAWASRSKLRPFVKLARTVRSHFEGIAAFLDERIANGLAEGMNNKIRLLSHRAFGFHSAQPLIATIYLCCAGITLPHLQLL